MNQVSLVKNKLNYAIVFQLIIIHFCALLIFFPLFLSWYNLIIGFIVFQITGFGVSIGFHRFLAHRSFVNVNPIFGFIHAFCGTLALQMGPISWARIHRDHHKYTDKDNDPHDRNKGFFYSHLGWMLYKIDMSKHQFGTDLVKINYVKFLEKHYLLINFLSLIFLFFLGFFLGFYNPLDFKHPMGQKYEIVGNDLYIGIISGLGMLVWAFFARIVLLYHITWSINSVCHKFGYHNFKVDTKTGTSKNNFLIGYISFGEGWHNNHHQFPYSAKFSHRWWEFDISWAYLCVLSKLKLCQPKLPIVGADNKVNKPVEAI